MDFLSPSKDDLKQSISCFSSIINVNSLKSYNNKQLEREIILFETKLSHCLRCLEDQNFSHYEDHLIKLLEQFNELLRYLDLNIRIRLSPYKGLLQYALASYYVMQNDYDKAWNVIIDFSLLDPEKLFKTDLERKMYLGDWEDFAKKYELTRVTVYAKVFLNKKRGSISIEKKYIQDSFALMQKMRKMSDQKLPEKYYEPLLEALDTKTQATTSELLLSILQELVNEGKLDEALKYANRFRKLFRMKSNNSFLERLPFEIAIGLEQSSLRSLILDSRALGTKIETVRLTFKLCQSYRKALVCLSDDIFQLINAYLADILNQILSTTLVPGTIDPKEFPSHSCEDDLLEFESNPEAIIVKYKNEKGCESKNEVVGLLLGAAVVMEKLPLVQTLLDLAVLEGANFTLLANVDNTGNSLLAHAFEVGNEEVLEIIKNFIDKQPHQPLVTFIHETDLGNILSTLEFPPDCLTTEACYYNYLKPVYQNLDSVVHFLDLMGISVSTPDLQMNMNLEQTAGVL